MTTLIFGAAIFFVGCFAGALFHERAVSREVREGFIEIGSGEVYRCKPLKDVSGENPYDEQ